MVSKILGYVLAIIGLVGLANSLIPELKILPQQFTGTTPMIISLVIVLLGLMIIMKGAGRGKVREVPIFEGKEVVGYRRHKK